MHLHSCNILNHIVLLEKESCKAQGYQEFSLKGYKNWYFNGLAGKRSQYSCPYCGSTTTECLVPLGARSRRKDIQVIPNDRDKLTKMVAISHRQNVMSLVSDVPSLPAAKHQANRSQLGGRDGFLQKCWIFHLVWDFREEKLLPAGDREWINTKTAINC